MKKSLLLILILLSIFQSMYGEEIENKEIKVTETKEESFTSKSTTESGIELKKEIKIEKKKKIAGLSPLLLITLLCQDSDDEETSSISVNGEDIPIVGSFTLEK